MIDNNLAFELPLNNVSTTTTAKNEITLEFHQNDDAAVSLMEIRFHIPGDPANQEVDTVQVSLCLLCFHDNLRPVTYFEDVCRHDNFFSTFVIIVFP